MELIRDDRLQNVHGGNMFTFSVGLLLGAMAVRGYDIYLNGRNQDEDSEVEVINQDPAN